MKIAFYSCFSERIQTEINILAYDSPIFPYLYGLVFSPFSKYYGLHFLGRLLFCTNFWAIIKVAPVSVVICCDDVLCCEIHNKIESSNIL